MCILLIFLLYQHAVTAMEICLYWCNLDIQLQRKNMSMESQNRDYHWVNHQMIENCVSGAHLKWKGPNANLEEVSNLKFLPTLDDQQRKRSNYIILTARSWLTTLMPWLLWSWRMHLSFISPTNTQTRWLESPRRYFPSFLMCKSIIYTLQQFNHWPIP